MKMIIQHWRSRFQSGAYKKDILGAVMSFAKWYLVMVFLIIIFQRHVMYMPSKQWIIQPSEIEANVVRYQTADHVDLTSWYIPPKSNMPVIVMFHGNAGNISNRALKQRYFAQKGYGFLLAEYRGYGQNGGSPSEDGLYTDARTAINWLIREQNISENTIIIYGESVGSGVASQMALEFKGVKALVLEAPFTNTSDLVGDIYPWFYPFKSMTLDRYDNISKAPYFHMPTLVIGGDKDRVISHSQHKKLAQKIGSPIKELVTLKGGGHNDLMGFRLLDEIDLFLGRLRK